jgi:imidazolonepropionase-like amidohydrolase
MTHRRRCPVLVSAALLQLMATFTQAQGAPQTRSPGNIALINGQWFDGTSFQRRQVYSIDGRFSFIKPARIDQTIDLDGTWIVPPFADAHSHSFGQGVPGSGARAASGYLAAGVFYVQSQGNLPMTAAEKEALRLNTPAGPDVTLSNGTLTSHKSALHALFTSLIIPSGAFQGYTLETLNNVRYFEIDTVAELRAKWPSILAQKSDFIKTYVWNTDDAPVPPVGPPALRGQHALSPEVFREIVRLAHASGLRVSSHVSTVGDLKLVVEGGADESAHLPGVGVVTPELAKLTASRGVPVVTTLARAGTVIESLPSSVRPLAKAMLDDAIRNLKTLVANGVTIAIGTDTPSDTTVREAAYLQSLGLFDNAAMLRMWGTATPAAIFPNRKIGALKEGYEASFLALEADPLVDWKATQKIRLRFKQGLLLDPMPQ